MRICLRRQRLNLVLLAALTLLAGCATDGGAICLGQRANTSAGTAASTTITSANVTGSVSLVTDHSIYAPGETITVTFANHLTAILDLPASIGCPFFGLERQVGSRWQNVPDCLPSPPPSGGDEAPGKPHPIYIEAGNTIMDQITQDDVSQGTYRVVGAFGEGYTPGGGEVTIYSQPLRFCTCAQCS